MKKIHILLIIIFTPFFIEAQILNTMRISDWNNLKSSGFYESLGGVNQPSTSSWYWGINIAHTLNTNNPDRYNYGAQILFPVTGSSKDWPIMYIRSTNVSGEGIWAKVLHDKGDQSIEGGLSISGDISTKKNINLENNAMIGRALFNTFTYDNQLMGHYALSWGDDSWSASYGPTLWQSAYGGMKFFTQGLPRMAIHFNGNVGIGTINPQAKLDVRGAISATEVKVQILTGADHVFNKDYNLKSLSEVKAFVEENKHLPEIPSEKEMRDNGLNMNEFQIKLLQKVEELTLYVIKQDEEIKKLKEILSAK